MQAENPGLGETRGHLWPLSHVPGIVALRFCLAHLVSRLPLPSFTLTDLLALSSPETPIKGAVRLTASSGLTLVQTALPFQRLPAELHVTTTPVAFAFKALVG